VNVDSQFKDLNSVPLNYCQQLSSLYRLIKTLFSSNADRFPNKNPDSFRNKNTNFDPASKAQVILQNQKPGETLFYRC
jgi:hypothetical protein